MEHRSENHHTTSERIEGSTLLNTNILAAKLFFPNKTLFVTDRVVSYLNILSASQLRNSDTKNFLTIFTLKPNIFRALELFEEGQKKTPCIYLVSHDLRSLHEWVHCLTKRPWQPLGRKRNYAVISLLYYYILWKHAVRVPSHFEGPQSGVFEISSLALIEGPSTFEDWIGCHSNNLPWSQVQAGATGELWWSHSTGCTTNFSWEWRCERDNCGGKNSNNEVCARREQSKYSGLPWRH